jgi:hypothetical protein
LLLHRGWEICCRSEALSASEEKPCCIQWRCFLLISVFEVQFLRTQNWITLNYIELLFSSLCDSHVSTVTKMAFAADCDDLLLTSYWHQHNMQLMTATPQTDTACTEQKDIPRITVKNACDVINRINRNGSPRWVQNCDSFALNVLEL